MFKEISIKPIPNGLKVVNAGLGNHCLICGGCFNRIGVCNNGHIKAKVYYCLPLDFDQEPKSEKSNAGQKKETEMVICQEFSGCHCSICGGYFADGDNICANGHQIGTAYPPWRAF